MGLKREATASIGRAPRLVAALRGTWLFLSLSLLALAGRAQAEPTVFARLAGEPPNVSESAYYEIVIRDYEKSVGVPDLPPIQNCAVTGPERSEQSSVSGVNGVWTRKTTTTFRWEIVPQKAGPVEIPAIEVDVDGRTLRTQPIRFTAGAVAATTSLLTLDIRCDAPHLWVGQQARFTLTITVVAPTTTSGQRISSRETTQYFAGANFGPFPTNVAIDTVQRVGDDGEPIVCYVYRSSTDLAINRPGPVTFDDVKVAMDYPTRVQKDFFGLRTMRQKRLIVTPTVNAPPAEPLPLADQPPGFSGAVGKFEITASALPHRVRVGDPITLTVEISGRGPIESLQAPKFAANQALTDGFRVPSDPLSGDYDPDRDVKRFSIVIRAKSADVREIPAIEFAYFDPDAGEYRIARSNAIPIEVAAVERLAAEDLQSFKTPETPLATPGPTPLDGLHGIRSDEDALLANTSRVSSWQVWLAAGLPALVGIAGVVLTVLRGRSDRDPAGRRRRSALKLARQKLAAARELSPAERSRAVESILANYLADRLNAPAGRFTGRSAVETLRSRGVNGDVLATCDALLARCEQSAYAGNAIDGDEVLQEADACLARLARARL